MAGYYFAYGSNMNFAQMRTRCPQSRFVRRATLRGYSFVYDGFSKSRKGAVANIIECEGGIVWGGVFEIDEDCLKKLDSCENYPNSYDRKHLDVQADSGDTFNAIAYFRIGRKPGKPSSAYRQIVIQGARDCGLPEKYIEEYL